MLNLRTPRNSFVYTNEENSEEENSPEVSDAEYVPVNDLQLIPYKVLKEN